MGEILQKIHEEVFNRCGFKISGLTKECESLEYDACQYIVNQKKVVSRTAKITPKKKRQFLTFWKRMGTGKIEPFHMHDNFDFFVVNIKSNDKLGQFVFPKIILKEKGINSTEIKEGKRAFRVYPAWDTVDNKQAILSQKWQLGFFYEIEDHLDFMKVKELFT